MKEAIIIKELEDVIAFGQKMACIKDFTHFKKYREDVRDAVKKVFPIIGSKNVYGLVVSL